MPEKRYIVTLTAEEREQLHGLVSKGKAAAYKQRHARVLLKADEGPDGEQWTDAEIARALEVHSSTIERLRQRFVEEGFEACLERKEQKNRKAKKFDGAGEARLTAVACSKPPEGRKRWTLKLLADEMVALEIVDSVCPETVRKTLKKNVLKPWLREMWCIPGGVSADYVCAMEDVLDVYHKPYDARHPVVCMDETLKQLIAETKEPIPVAAGQPARYGYQYKRQGVANLFLLLEPLTGDCHIQVTERHTRKDWALFIRDLVDKHFPEADIITLVMDNLSTHKKAALYEVFPPEEAKRIADKLDIHFTPKYASWLNMAEIGFNILSRQCLDRRIPTMTELTEQVNAWLQSRQDDPPIVNWQFTTKDARIKLRRLYPSLQTG